MKAHKSNPRSRELAKIHIGAKQLGLIRDGDKDEYRLMLFSIARVRSAADLDAAGRQRVLAHLRKCGATFTRPKGSSKYKRGSQAAYIRFLWSRLNQAGEIRDGSDRAMRTWCKRETAKYHPEEVGYEVPQMMPAAVASKVIEQLKQWCDRAGVKR